MHSRRALHDRINKCLALALSANNHAQRNGIKATLKKLITYFKNSQITGNPRIKADLTLKNLVTSLRKWSDIDRDTHPDLNPIGVYKVKGGESYTTIVTDSIGRKSLFGGVGTALILGTLIANNRNQPLRIVTRTEPATPDDYSALLHAYDLRLDNELVLNFNPRTNDNISITYAPGDLFITTSWWTTQSCLKRIGPESILYLIQEDERSFYPLSDLYLECEKIMRHPGLKFAVNSRLLWNHFEACGFANIIQNGNWFEPNFKRFVKPYRSYNLAKKRRLFFYARPNNPRNLFRTGVNAINSALVGKIINPNEWEIIFAGSNLEEFVFDDGTIPQIVTGLSWTEYLDLISGIDIGISLMATPHPSYPPLDLASAGAVVITNKFGVKESLEDYCANIICAAPTEYDLLRSIQKALVLIEDNAQISANLQNSSFVHSWQECLSCIVNAHA